MAIKNLCLTGSAFVDIDDGLIPGALGELRCLITGPLLPKILISNIFESAFIY